MKVGVNARTFSVDQPDGAVQASVRLTNELNNIPDVEVTCYCPEPIPDDRIEAPTKSPRFGSTSQFYGVVWERTLLPLMVLQDDIDVLLCPNGNAPFTPIPGIKIVTYIHDVNALKGMSGGIHRTYRRVAVPRSASVSDRIITVSEFSKSEIIDVLDVPSEKVDVVYNGIDDVFLDDTESISCDLPDNYILYVGAMNPRKNIQGILDAFEQLKSQTDFPHKLVLVGPQNKMVYQNFEVEESDDVVTPGFLPVLELKYAYENADVFLYLSFYEGFGLPPLEAMACRTLVVSSDRTALSEILEGHACLVDPTSGEAITNAAISILNGSCSISQNDSRKYAEKFTWKRSADKLYTVFRSI